MTPHNTQQVAALRHEIKEHQAEAIELLGNGMFYTTIHEIKNCIDCAEKIRVIRGE